MAKVYVTRELPGTALDTLKRVHEVEVYQSTDGGAIPREILLEKVRGVEAILPLLTDKIDSEVFEAAGDTLQVVANYAVGYDNIDVGEASRRGIVVTNTPGVLTEAVVEHTWALVLSVVRRVVEADTYTRAGKYRAWGPGLFLGMQLEGKVMGIVGLGRIGTLVAQRARRGFEMSLVYHTRHRNEEFEKEFEADYVSLNELLSRADVVSLHVPLTNETRHLIGRDQLAKMKPVAYLINTARGALVDEAALVEAIESGKIAGAGLDVFEFEPQVNERLTTMDNVVLTPHIASATVEVREEMVRMTVSNILAVLAGKEPENLVTAS